MEESNTLNILLERAAHYHPLYDGGLAAHIPMVMIALDRLHATSCKLQNIFNESIKELEFIGSLDCVNAVEGIELNLGDSKKFRSYLKYFKYQLEVYGTEAVLKKSLPILILGVSASAFHALIRLGYAIEANSQSEIAIALAYWSAEFQSLELNVESSNETLEDIVTRLTPIGESHRFSPGIIVNRMSEIGQLLKHGKFVIQPHSVTLADLKSFSLKAFCIKNDFTLLHTVTGCHAFSMITPYLENVDAALKELWKAILVAYLSTGLDYADKEIKLSKSIVDFQPVISNAIESNDSHVIKLVYTCFREYMEYQNPLYYIVAKRAVYQ